MEDATSFMDHDILRQVAPNMMKWEDVCRHERGTKFSIYSNSWYFTVL